MAWETVTYACGHTGEVQLYGKRSDREWRKSKLAQELCPECEQKRLDEENAKAAEEMKEIGAVELIGTQKQILWAEGIRNMKYQALIKRAQQIIDDRKNWLESAEKKGDQELIEKQRASLECVKRSVDYLKEEILSERSASKIIDDRDKSVDNRILSLAHEIENNPEAYKINESSKKSQVLEPESKTKAGYATVKICNTELEGSEIGAFYPKDDDFIAICKKHGFLWRNGAWRRRPRNNSHSVTDSTAHLVNDLLYAGFAVEVNDAYVIDSVKSGDFLPDEKEYIYIEGDIKKVAVHSGRDEVRKFFLSLPGTYTKYKSNDIVVNKRFADEIMEAADTFKIFIDELAASRLSKVIESKKQIQVTPESKDAEVSSASLKDVLNSSREVLDDLKI